VTTKGHPATGDAAEALAQSERRFRALTEKASEILAIVDAKGNVVQESPNQIPVLGYADGELLGRSVFELLHPDDQTKALTAFQEVVGQLDATRRMEARARTRQGGWLWLDIVGTNLLNDPAVNGIVLNCRDITERKRIEEELRAAKHSLDRIWDAVFWLKDDGHVANVNQAACRSLGYTREELLQMHVSDFDVDSRPEHHRQRRQEMRQQGYARFEVRHRRKDGTFFPAEIYAIYMQFEGEDYICAVVRDLTERKQAEEAVAASERRLRALVEKGVGGITILDASGQVVYDVATVSPWIGFMPEDMVGKSIFDLIHPEDRAKAGAAFRQLLEAPDEVLTLDLRVQTKDGSVRILQVTGTNRLRDPAIRGIVVNSFDITGRKLAEIAVQERESTLRSFYNSSPMLMGIVELEGDEIIHIYDNVATEHFFHAPHGSSAGRSATELGAPRVAVEIWLANYRRSRDEGRPVRFEYEHPLPHGVRWLSATVAFIGEETGRPRYCYVAEEITERKQAESRFRQLTDQQVAGIYMFRDGKIRYANRYFCDMFGYAPEEIYALDNAVAVLIPDDRALVEEQHRKRLHGEVKSVHYELRGRRKDGAIIHLEAHGGVEIMDGKPTLIGVLIDRSAREKAKAELRLEKEFTAKLLDAPADTVFVFEPGTGKAIRWNQVFRDVTGYSDEEIASLKAPDAYYSEADLRCARAAIERILQEGKGTVRISLVTKAGKAIPFEYAASVVTDSTGAPRFVISIGRDITERHKMEAALRESEARYRTLFEQAADMIVLIDPDTLGFLDFNDETCRRLGYSREEFAKLRIPDLDVVESAAETSRHVKKIAVTHMDVFETKQRTKNGAILDLEVRSSPVRLGEKTFLLAVWRDITARKQMENVLAQKERLLRNVGDSVPDGAVYRLIQTRDGRTHFEYVSAGFALLFELTEGVMVRDATSLYAMAHPDDRDDALNAQKRSAETLTPFRHECRFNLPSGKSRWVRWHSMPEQLADGGTAWSGVAIDITERKRMENALRENEARFRTLAEAVPLQIWIVDPKGYPEYANQQRFQYTGITLEQAQAANGWWSAVHPDDQPLVRQNWLRSLKSGEPFQCEYRLRRAADGQYRWFLGRGIEITDEEGRPLKWFGTVTDIDEQKRIEEVLEQRVQLRTAQLRQEIAERKRLEQQILEVSEREQRRIGHDLHDSVGQRLTGTKFLSSALGRRLARAKTPGSFAAARISRELDKALEDVRTIVRGLAPVPPDHESLMPALHELARSTTHLFNIPCRFECPHPVLIGDHAAAIHLYRVAQESVSNAVRHAKAKHIRITLRRSKAGIELRVLDDGCGLPSRSRRRAGMGLEIMKHRAAVIGAAFKINRARTGGTIVSCVWAPPAKGASHVT